MQQPFDITVADIHYAVFPEGDDTYTIYKDGKEYMQIQKDEEQWLKLDDETALPLFEPNEEVNLLGKEIAGYKEEEEDEEDSDFFNLDEED